MPRDAPVPAPTPVLHGPSIHSAPYGQAFAAYNGLRNGAELIALAFGGALVAAIGGAGTLWLAGGAAGAAGLGGVLALSSRRQPAAVQVD